MNKIEQCKQCQKRKFEAQRGILCGLTGDKPTFESECPNFEKDEQARVNPNWIKREYNDIQLISNNGIAKVLIMIFWGVIGALILSIGSNFLQYELLNGIEQGIQFSEEELLVNDDRQQTIFGFYLLLFTTSMIVFLFWFQRAYKNLHRLDNKLSFSTNWAIGCWFVPFINFIRPMEIMSELYTQTRIVLKRDFSLDTQLEDTYIGLWWFLWIFNGVANKVSSYFIDLETLSGYMTLTIVDTMLNILGLILTFVTIKVVKDYAKAEKLLKEYVG